MVGATGYLVEEMVTGAVAEILLGLRRDVTNVLASLDGLERGDGFAAGLGYQRLVSRWGTKVQALKDR